MWPFIFSLVLMWSASSSWSAPQAGSVPTPPTASPTTGVIQLLCSGKLGLKQLKKFSYISNKVLARDKSFTVYAGFRDPVFQVVLWGPSEKPERVLLEFDPKKTTVDTLREFTADFAAGVGQTKPVSGTMDSLSKENAEHIKAYCAKLPAGASCSVETYTLPAGRLVRVDIHLKVGPAVPKAVEFQRAH